MPNMSYCKFQNTALDLRDCHESILEHLQEEEQHARYRLMRLCRDVLQAVEVDLELSDEELKKINERLQVEAARMGAERMNQDADEED